MPVAEHLVVDLPAGALVVRGAPRAGAPVVRGVPRVAARAVVKAALRVGPAGASLAEGTPAALPAQSISRTKTIPKTHTSGPALSYRRSPRAAQRNTNTSTH